MTELEILQKRFSNMAQQFPGLMHILTTWPKGKKEPKLNPKYMPTKDNLLIIWGDGLVRGYMPNINMKHWLIKPRSQSWNKDHACENFQNLAEKAGRVLCEKGLLCHLKPPEYILKLFGNESINSQTAQFWVLVVHELGKTKGFVIDPHDSKACWLQNLNVRDFDKELIRTYYEVQKDFFYESSVIILRLLEIKKDHKLKKKSSAAKTNEPLSDKALAVLNLLQNLPPNKALTGPQIIDKLSKEKMSLDQSALTKSIIPALKPHGVKNKPRIGYYIEKK